MAIKGGVMNYLVIMMDDRKYTLKEATLYGHCIQGTLESPSKKDVIVTIPLFNVLRVEHRD